MTEAAEQLQEKPSTPRIGLTEGLLIAGLPAAAYLLAYAYEAGFGSAFALPRQFIHLDLVVVVVAGAALSSAGFMLLMWSNVVVMLYPADAGPVLRSFFMRFVPLLLPLVVIIAFYGPHWREWTAYAAILGFLALLHFGWPLLVRNGSLSYRERFAAEEEADRKLPDIYSFVAQKLGILTLIVLVVGPVALYTAWHVGRANALRQVEFLVPLDAPDYVILRTYGDRLILGQINRKARTVGGVIHVRDVRSQGPLEMRWEKLGPLRSEKVD